MFQTAVREHDFYSKSLLHVRCTVQKSKCLGSLNLHLKTATFNVHVRLIWINYWQSIMILLFLTRKFPSYRYDFNVFPSQICMFERFSMEFSPLSKCSALHDLSTNYKYYCVSEFDCFSLMCRQNCPSFLYLV